MSAQVKSYRWSDKPVAAKQSILTVLLLIVGGVLVFKFRARQRALSEVHAFTQGKKDHSTTQTAQDISKSGSVAKGAINKTSRYQSRAGGAPSNRNEKGIQERPVFDGLTVVLETELQQSLSSSSGDTSLEVSVVAMLPGEGSQAADSSIQGAKLSGQFQPNFETKRMMIQFRELVTSDGRRYAVSGFALDFDGQSSGVPADYSSGMATRILGATLGTAISTAEIVATSRVIENGAGQDALMSSQLNSAISSSTQGATSTISEEATKGLKSQRAVLSLSAGVHFRVKLRQVMQGQSGGAQ
jgi:hypothetical protein